jgi:two-component system response regulator
MENGTPVDILLVEDNPTDAELVLRVLRKNNLANNVVWVKDGKEALDFLFRRGNYAARANSMPRVIFLDLRLPKVDGLEVLRQMRDNEHTRTIPVVVLTSSKEESDIAASYLLGANSFVPKPVGFDEFSSAVAELGGYWLLLNKIPAKRGIAP